MKRSFLTSIFCALFIFSFSQSDESLVKAGSKGLYIEHKIVAKENFYSLGRSYTVHPKHIATFNALDMGKGLSVGQAINIPLSDSNFNRNAAEGKPLYYKSSMKQTVGSISAISKTPAGNIRKWNNLTNDIAPGAAVIIGYLVDAGEEPAAVVAANKEADQQEPKAQSEEKKQTVTTPKEDLPKKADTVKRERVKETPKIVRDETKKNPVIPATSSTGDGFFKDYFTQQIKTYPLSKDETVTSGIFKTTSGWSDNKYYALLDGATPGTIIKIINPANGKAVYAKILGKLSGIRQNEGYNLRISNAAASVLEITETDKFIVKVNY